MSIFGMAFDGNELSLEAFAQALEADIARTSKALKEFSFGDVEAAELPKMREPGLGGAIGAGLLGILNPGAPEAFAQRAATANRYNTQLEVQALRQAEDMRRAELLSQFGIDKAQYENLLGLRQELLRMQMRAKFGQTDETTNRMQTAALLKAIDDGASIDEVLSVPDNVKTLAYAYGHTEPDVEKLRPLLEARSGEGARERSIENRRVDVAEGNLAERTTENIGEGITQVSEADQDIINLETAVLEAVDKVDQNWLSRTFMGEDPLDPNDPRLDKEIKLKTKIRGKERYTLRQLLALRDTVIYMRTRLEQLRSLNMPQVPVSDPLGVQGPAPPAQSGPRPTVDDIFQ